MNEPSIFLTPSGTMPLDVVHRIDEPGFAKRFATHAEIHNVYGMQNARATFEGLKQLDPDQRPMVLTRAAYAGGQRYGETWTGDNSSTWNHLRLTTPMLKNLGLSGFAFTLSRLPQRNAGWASHRRRSRRRRGVHVGP
jgi:alpha-glucosidase